MTNTKTMDTDDIELADFDPGLCELFYKLQEFFGCSPENVLLAYDKGHGDEEGAFFFFEGSFKDIREFSDIKGLIIAYPDGPHGQSESADRLWCLGVIAVSHRYVHVYQTNPESTTTQPQVLDMQNKDNLMIVAFPAEDEDYAISLQYYEEYTILALYQEKDTSHLN